MGSIVCLLSPLSVTFEGRFRSKSPPLVSGVGAGVEAGGGEVRAVVDVDGDGVSGATVVLGGVVVGKSNSPNLFSASGAFVGSWASSESRVDSDALGEPPASEIF
jgi:hypothetical protein